MKKFLAFDLSVISVLGLSSFVSCSMEAVSIEQRIAIFSEQPLSALVPTIADYAGGGW